jgi:hypothetical protein
VFISTSTSPTFLMSVFTSTTTSPSVTWGMSPLVFTISRSTSFVSSWSWWMVFLQK